MSHVSRRILVAAALVLVCRLFVSLIVIPPWQQPDEHAQVAVAEVWRNRILATKTPDPGRQAEILRSMDEHNWWQHYNRSTPHRPLPDKFELAPAGATLGIEPTSNGYPPFYYSVVGAAFSMGPRLPVVNDLYVMRTFSMVLAVLTLLAAWSGARVVLGERGAAVVTLLLALHPQFAVVSTSAGPDALVNLAGACVWWQAMLVWHRAKWIGPLVLAWVAAAVGALADRMGVPLLVAVFLVSVAAVLRRRGFRLATIAGIGTAAAAVVLALWAIDRWWGSFPAAVVGYHFELVPRAQRSDFFLQFTSFLVQSWWFALGWVRYAPPWSWVATAFALTACAFAGTTRRWLIERDRGLRTVIGLACLMIATQVGAVFWTYYRIAHGPQGRHLFPFLVPTLVLVWIGVETLTPARFRGHAAVGLVLTFALLDSVAWIGVGLGAYAG